MSAPREKEEQDLYDTTIAASAAEADILEAANANKASPHPHSHPHPHPTSSTSGKEDTTTPFPPVDIFASPSHWTLHFSVAGAKKGDVSVAWDRVMSAVLVRGVVNLPSGGGEGLGSLVASERRVGGFERVVGVPKVSKVVGGDSGEGGGDGDGKGVEGEGLESWLEDGVLVVRVPKGRGE